MQIVLFYNENAALALARLGPLQGVAIHHRPTIDRARFAGRVALVAAFGTLAPAGVVVHCVVCAAALDPTRATQAIASLTQAARERGELAREGGFVGVVADADAGLLAPDVGPPRALRGCAEHGAALLCGLLPGAQGSHAQFAMAFVRAPGLHSRALASS